MSHIANHRLINTSWKTFSRTSSLKAMLSLETTRRPTICQTGTRILGLVVMPFLQISSLRRNRNQPTRLPKYKRQVHLTSLVQKCQLRKQHLSFRQIFMVFMTSTLHRQKSLRLNLLQKRNFLELNVHEKYYRKKKTAGATGSSQASNLTQNWTPGLESRSKTMCGFCYAHCRTYCGLTVDGKE